jgi:retinol dehydrogenase 12
VVMFTKMISYEPIYGAYTELFAGLSPEITIEQSGAWSMQSAKTIAEGGTGVGEKFWQWSEEQIKPYL